MLVTKVSTFTGKTNTMDLPVTQEQIDRYAGGALVQIAFPNLSAAQREFIMTGCTPEEWEAMFPRAMDAADFAVKLGLDGKPFAEVAAFLGEKAPGVSVTLLGDGTGVEISSVLGQETHRFPFSLDDFRDGLGEHAMAAQQAAGSTGGARLSLDEDLPGGLREVPPPKGWTVIDGGGELAACPCGDGSPCPGPDGKPLCA